MKVWPRAPPFSNAGAKKELVDSLDIEGLHCLTQRNDERLILTTFFKGHRERKVRTVHLPLKVWRKHAYTYSTGPLVRRYVIRN